MITDALHDIESVCDTLREAYAQSKGAESIVLLNLLGHANELRRDIEVMDNATREAGE